MNSETNNKKFSALTNLAQAHLINETLADFYTDEETGKAVKIDLYDLTLLDLVRDICLSKNMDSLVITECPEEYHFLVTHKMTRIKYQSVINQVPLLNLNSSVSVSRRIDKLVRLGLIDKITVASKEGGKTTYVSLTDLAEILYQKVSTNDENTKEVINRAVNGLLTELLTTLLTDGLIRLLYNKTINTLDNKPAFEKAGEKKEKTKVQNNFDAIWKDYTLGFLKKQNRRGGVKGKAFDAYKKLLTYVDHETILKLVDFEKTKQIGHKDLERVFRKNVLDDFLDREENNDSPNSQEWEKFLDWVSKYREFLPKHHRGKVKGVIGELNAINALKAKNMQHYSELFDAFRVHVEQKGEMAKSFENYARSFTGRYIEVFV